MHVYLNTWKWIMPWTAQQIIINLNMSYCAAIRYRILLAQQIAT